MKAYILPILSASLIAGVIEHLAPKGEGGRMAAHVRLIAGLFLLVTLLNPLREGILFLKSAAEGNLADRLTEVLPEASAKDYEEVFLGVLADTGVLETEAWVLSALETVFHIPPTACAVEVTCEAEGNTLALREVRIALRGEFMWEDPHPIEAYMSAQLQCPCYVTVQP